MKIWIDLANSPHPLFFSPVADRLEELGHEVAVTVRDHAQTLALARERWPAAEVIGSSSPDNRFAKATSVLRRVGGLARWARHHRPDRAVSHNSYAQIVAARVARIPAATAMDYEHQPVNHLAFRLAARIVIPEALPLALVRRQGGRAGKVYRYQGFKEELYLGAFAPDPSVASAFRHDRNGRGPLVVARTPPSGAMYHRLDNPLFELALRSVSSYAGVCVVLCRSERQRQAVSELGMANVVVPPRALDSRSLIREADMFLGAGGTMSRESALMGVPTYSLFSGEVPAVDRDLEQRGLITRIERAGDIPATAPDATPRVPLKQLRSRGLELRDELVDALLGNA